MAILQSIVLALIQGVTEFIPISSSGHLVLVREFLGWSDENGVFFDVVLHAASLLAIFVYFFRDWFQMFLAAVCWRDAALKADRRLLGQLLAATIPVALLGPWLEPHMGVFRRGGVIGLIMILTALWFLFCEWRPAAMREKLTWGAALLMGLAQVLAVLPGASRSGLTISTGVLAGQRRVHAARFSFFMVAPTIVGAVILESMHLPGAALNGMLWPLLTGFAVCFATSLACIHFCLGLFRRYSLSMFAFYLIGMGTALLLLRYA
ncbi:MAG: undecaprenyl-diphosphate phosphatase [Kiritimatiellae bacterium]|nr:undecaprenyl-diphosphate phosphatase [Kiritimatiellia bacterium]